MYIQLDMSSAGGSGSDSCIDMDSGRGIYVGMRTDSECDTDSGSGNDSGSGRYSGIGGDSASDIGIDRGSATDMATVIDSIGEM